MQERFKHCGISWGRIVGSLVPPAHRRQHPIDWV